MLHQVSPITIDGDEGNHIGLFEEVIKLLIGRYKGLKVEESNKILDVNHRFQIRNMILKLEGDDHGI